MNVKVMGLVIAGGIAFASGVQADTAVKYSFTGSNASGGGTAGASDGATALGSGAAIVATNVTVQTNTDVFSASGFPTTGTLATPEVTDSLSFTFDPNGTVSLSRLRIDERHTRASGIAGPLGITIRSSLTGTTNLVNVLSAEDATVTRTHDMDLSGIAALQNISSNVTFTVFGWDADSGTNAGAMMVLDNIHLEGTGGIPEPASLGLVALGATALIRRRQA